MKQLAVIVLIMLCGCTSPTVIGISHTNRYISGIYNVDNCTIYGFGYVSGKHSRLVIGYDHTIVSEIATGNVYETMVRIKEYQLMDTCK